MRPARSGRSGLETRTEGACNFPLIRKWDRASSAQCTDPALDHNASPRGVRAHGNPFWSANILPTRCERTWSFSDDLLGNKICRSAASKPRIYSRRMTSQSAGLQETFKDVKSEPYFNAFVHHANITCGHNSKNSCGLRPICQQHKMEKRHHFRTLQRISWGGISNLPSGDTEENTDPSNSMLIFSQI